MGRSRSGLTTKIHALIDANGLPIKLKRFRAVATRYEKHDTNYLAVVKLASARIWMRFMSR